MDGDSLEEHNEGDSGGAETTCGAAVSSASASSSSHQTETQCGCDSRCFRFFDAGEIEAHRLSIQDLEKTEKEVLVLGVLESCRHEEEQTTKGKRRRRTRFSYQYRGHPVCVTAFRHFYSLGQKEFRNLLNHLSENGAIPCVHGNKGRKLEHALSFAEVKVAVTFIQNHAERYGIPHPAPLYGRDSDPPVILPASQNFKTVHLQYVQSCLEAQVRDVAWGFPLSEQFGTSVCSTFVS